MSCDQKQKTEKRTTATTATTHSKLEFQIISKKFVLKVPSCVSCFVFTDTKCSMCDTYLCDHCTVKNEKVYGKVCCYCQKSVIRDEKVCDQIENGLESISCVCPLCEFIVDGNDVIDHLFHDCKNRPMKCKNCNEQIKRSEKRKHDKESCKSRIVTCSYCNCFLPATQIEKHMNDCLKKPVVCTRCNLQITSNSELTHLRFDCKGINTRLEKNNKQQI
jgi:hypothetical protein